jgi:hypothetical protein
VARKPTPAIPIWLIGPYGIKQSTEDSATYPAGLILRLIPLVEIQASGGRVRLSAGIDRAVLLDVIRVVSTVLVESQS